MRSIRWSLLLGLLASCARAGFSPPASQPADGDAGIDAARDADTGGDDGSHDGSISAPFKLYLTLEGEKASYFRVLTFDPRAPTSTAMDTLGPPLLLPDIQGNGVRGLATGADGPFIAGDGFGPVGQLIASDGQKTIGVLALSNAGALPQEIPQNLHGLCVLPAGNLILGEFGNDSGNAISEYTLAGSQASFVRLVALTLIDSGTLVKCVAPSDNELYLMEFDANNDTEADLVHLTRDQDTGAWSEVGRFDGSAFDVLQGASKTSYGAFVLHDDGSLYLFPLQRNEQRLKALVRCPRPIVTASCELRGQLPPYTGTVHNGPDTINAAVQIPDSEEMLFGTNSRIYRYRLANDSYEELMEIKNRFSDLKTGSGAQDTLKQLRGMVIRR